MISLSEIVLRLREKCPAFHDTATGKRRIGGTAAFEDAFEASADLPVPHCFVIPLYGQDVTGLDNADLENRQTIRQYFATIVCLDNSVSRGTGGKNAGAFPELDAIAAVQEEIATAFQGWKPIQRFDPIRYYRDLYLKSDNRRIWHQFEWYLTYFQDPNNGPGEDDVLDELYGDLDNDTPYADSLLANLNKIYTTYHEDTGMVRAGVRPMESWDDFWQHRFCDTHATPEEVEAKVAAATSEIEISPTDQIVRPEQVRDEISYVNPPLSPFLHGIETTEFTDGAGI